MEIKFSSKFSVREFGLNKKPKTFVFYGFQFYKKAYFIVDDVKILEGPEKIGNKITIIIIIHLKGIESFICQRNFPYNSFVFIISPNILGIWNDLEITEVSIKL